LAYALIGQKNEAKIRIVQFHPNLSYEDFVRGWRPSGEGKLSLTDGPFMEIINAAKQEPSIRYVMVIEEINRGNPAQIFGEMLTLLEADKRTPNEAIELCYKPAASSERVFIPDNLYVVGTMNIADRSLALVDLALRRRFAFVDLEPKFGELWRIWVTKKCGFDAAFVGELERRINALNEEIAADSSLGKKFCVGHSFLTPPLGLKIDDAVEWYKQVVATEIGPLLEEYWFDSIDTARAVQRKLTDGL
jgi:5-methylcytosine-specific restriction protein B